MYAIMGQRGQPRTKPPRSVEEGLWRRPTVLNNTETFASVPAVIRNGGAWYASLGTKESTGTKLITMQGPVRYLGVAEIEMGLPMRQLIFDVFGGCGRAIVSRAYRPEVCRQVPCARRSSTYRSISTR